MTLDARSESRMVGVHPDLVKVIHRAFATYTRQNPRLSFFVTEGLRTAERQRALVAAKASRTLNSRHLTGHAVDLAIKMDGELRWDWPLYAELGRVVKQCAVEMGVPITWGGDWRSLRDGPHFELSRVKYK